MRKMFSVMVVMSAAVALMGCAQGRVSLPENAHCVVDQMPNRAEAKAGQGTNEKISGEVVTMGHFTSVDSGYVCADPAKESTGR